RQPAIELEAQHLTDFTHGQTLHDDLSASKKRPMVVNKSCVAACLESDRMAVESVSGCSWNECPDQRGITVRMCVEWVSESAWNPQANR
ncbi:MAG: hypothetical protein ACK561_10745, partial [Pseudomonadaceae bacterium]